MRVGLCQGTSFQPMSSARIKIMSGCLGCCPPTHWDKHQRLRLRVFIALRREDFHLENIQGISLRLVSKAEHSLEAFRQSLDEHLKVFSIRNINYYYYYYVLMNNIH